MIACLLQDPISQGTRSDVSNTSQTGEDPAYNRKKKDVFSGLLCLMVKNWAP
jgi:hypothetical protein